MLAVIYEDNHLLVIDKPPGMLTHSDATGDDDLVSAAKRYLVEQYDKPGDAFAAPAHRLDRPVGGVLVIARTSKCAARLARQFQQRSIAKRYHAIVRGTLDDEGELRHRLIKEYDEQSGATSRVVAEGGQEAVTRYRVVERRGGRILVDLEPVTGRPHQLRVQLAAAGCPIVGDTKYGAPEPLPDRCIALRARAITIEHPTRKEPMTFEADPPESWPW